LTKILIYRLIFELKKAQRNDNQWLFWAKGALCSKRETNKRKRSYCLNCLNYRCQNPLHFTRNFGLFKKTTNLSKRAKTWANAHLWHILS